MDMFLAAMLIVVAFAWGAGLYCLTEIIIYHRRKITELGGRR